MRHLNPKARTAHRPCNPNNPMPESPPPTTQFISKERSGISMIPIRPATKPPTSSHTSHISLPRPPMPKIPSLLECPIRFQLRTTHPLPEVFPSHIDATPQPLQSSQAEKEKKRSHPDCSRWRLRWGRSCESPESSVGRPMVG